MFCSSLLRMILSLLYASRSCSRCIHLAPLHSSFSGHRSHSRTFTFAFPPVTTRHLPAPTLTGTILCAKKSSSNMRGVKKENLPSKLCLVCNRPFTWRKKWERCWEEVTTCSKSCNAKRKARKNDLSGVVREDHVSASNEDFLSGDVIDKGRVHLKVPSSSDEDIRADVSKGIEMIAGISDHEIQDIFPNVENLDLGNDDGDSLPSYNAFDTSPIESYDEYFLLDCKAKRKAEKKRMKAERRAQREGRGDPSAGRKPCDICNKSVNVLIRCTYDISEKWGMVCGSCWRDVSGGVVDGDEVHPYYRYGGLWKNRRAQKP